MSFGYSVGDFITGANLSYQLIQALSGAHCPSEEYREALIELGCMQQTFLQVGRMTTNPTLSPDTVNAAAHIALSSMTLIGDFLTKTKKYRERLSGREAGNAASDSWRKVGWVLFKKDELKALRDALHIKLTSISLLLETARFYERHAVADETSSTSAPLPPPSYSHLAGENLGFLGPIERKQDLSTNSLPRVQSRQEKEGSSEMRAKSDPLDELSSRPQRTEAGGEKPTGPHNIKKDPLAETRPGLQPFPFPTNPRRPVQSTRIMDITPPIKLDEQACKERLTTFDAYSIHKSIPRDPKERATWARSEVVKEPISQEDISKAVKCLNESKETVQDKKLALGTFQQGQINHLLDDLNSTEQDLAFCWTLAQLDLKEFMNEERKTETAFIVVYVKRAPIRDVNPILLFQTIERIKAERWSKPPPMPSLASLPVGHARPGQTRNGHDKTANPKDLHETRRIRPKAPLNNFKIPIVPKKKSRRIEKDGSSSDYGTTCSGSLYDSMSDSESNTTRSVPGGRNPSKASQNGRAYNRNRHSEERRKNDDGRWPPAPTVSDADESDDGPGTKPTTPATLPVDNSSIMELTARVGDAKA